MDGDGARSRAWWAPVRALAHALFDGDHGVPEDRIAWALDDLASFLDHAGPRTSFLFAVTALIIEWLPIFFIARPSRMSRLSPADRMLYLEALDRTRLAIVLVLPKALLALVYYEHPDAVRETGYDGSCLMGELPAGVGVVQIARRAREEAHS